VINLDYTKLLDNSNAILNELTDDYKKMLIERAIERNNLNSVEEVRPRDLILIDYEIRQGYLNKVKNAKRERIMKLISLTGIMYMIIGVIAYLYFSIDFNHNPVILVSFLMTIIGALITLSSYFYNIFERDIKKRKPPIEGNNKPAYVNEWAIISKWNEIEDLLYKKAEEQDINAHILIPNTPIPISRLINNLILNEYDKKDYRAVLALRNNLIYHNNEEISNEKMEEGLDTANKIIMKLTE